MPFGVFPKHHSNLCFSSYLLNAQSSLLNAKVMLELNSILLLGIMDNVMSNICLFKSWARQRDSVLRCICALILVNKPQLIIHECLSTENAVKVRNWCRFLFTIFEMSGSASAGHEVSFTKVAGVLQTLN